MLSISLVNTSELSICWPVAAAFTALTSPCGGVVLSKNPAAPARRAHIMNSSVSKAVSMTTGVRLAVGWRLASVSTASNPSITGMRMSVNTTSGLSCAMKFKASLPLVASPIT